MCHKAYLKENRRAFYSFKIVEGTFQRYLEEIDRQEEEMYLRLVKEMAAQYEVTDALKESDQMLWVQKMNQICESAREIVNAELIYV